MKIRSDYVSNSSSSSFILSDMDVFKHFNITKQDIMDALVDAYGKERFEQYIADRKKRSLDPEWSKWYSKNRKWNQWGPIYVFDLHDENDNAAAREMFGSMLKDWDANNCHTITDDEEYMGELRLGETYKDYRNAIDAISSVYDVPEYELETISKSKRAAKKDLPTTFIRTKEKDSETGFYGRKTPIPQHLVTTLRDIRRKCGIITNYELLSYVAARFFIHADDNEILMLKGMDEFGNDETSWNPKTKSMEVAHPESEWESESSSFGRVMEILFNWLVKNHRLNPVQPDFIAKHIVDQPFQPRPDDSVQMDFHNGGYFSWEDLVEYSLTYIMHEG